MNTKPMREILRGFRQFILRGNVLDLAVGVVIGAAFNGVVSSLVKDLFTPLIAAVAHQGEFPSLSFSVNGSTFMYGDFLNSLISFLITAIAVYFFVILPINTLNARFKKGVPTESPTKQCPECLSNIPKDARRCAYCTIELNRA